MEDKPRKTHIEGIIYDKFVHMHGSGGISMRFPVQCTPYGIGGNGQNLASPRKRIEGCVRAAQRTLCPWLWI
jgi:hypothetical protein